MVCLSLGARAEIVSSPTQKTLHNLRRLLDGTLGQARCYYDRKRLNGQPCVREKTNRPPYWMFLYFNLRILLLLLDVNNVVYSLKHTG